MMKGQAYEPLELDAPLEKKQRGIFARHSRLLWGCLVIIATAVVVHQRSKGDGVLDRSEVVAAGEDVESQPSTDVSVPNVAGHDTSSVWEDPIQKFQPATAPKLGYSHNVSFPGMNDTNTKTECCAARIIVELERQFSQNLPLPFTTLQFDDSNKSMCGSVIESVENYPGCCGLPADVVNDDSPFWDGTIPFWIEHCLPYNNYNNPEEDPYTNANMTGFMVYYDWCPAYLIWDRRPCHEWINATKEAPREILQEDLPLVDGEFTGIVVTSPNLWGKKEHQTSIFVPDVFDSCWQVDCGWGSHVNTSSCIQFAVQNLKRVSLAHYVDTIKHVWCE